MRVVRVRTDEGARAGLLVAEGPKYASIISPDASGIRVLKLAWAETVKHRGARIQVKLQLEDVRFNGGPYPVARAKRLLRKMGRRVGITKQAKKFLKG